MTKGLSLFMIITMLTPFSQAVANDTAFGGKGALPYPIEQPNVKMLAEKIEIIGREIDRDGYSGQWDYSCEFIFQNRSDMPIDLKMGFPLPVFDDIGEVAVPYGQSIKKGDPLIYQFAVTLNGKPVVASRKSISKNPLHDLEYKEAYLWDAEFMPNQIIKIHHHYLTGATFNVMGFNYVDYVLKTGALWQDKAIGNTKIIVKPNTRTRLCSELYPNETYLKPTPKGIKISTEGKNRIYSWNLNNFTPTEDLSLCLQTGKNYVRFSIVFPLLNLLDNPNFNLNKLNNKSLWILKNTIYAQYGRKFESNELQNYFDKSWWYEQNSNYSDSLLTVEDKKALQKIETRENQLKLEK